MINQTENGKIFKCSKCDKIHIEYKNLNFSFTYKEYESFAAYIKDLDGKNWEDSNHDSLYSRKIMISILHDNFNILLHNYELEELKFLLSEKKDNNDIKYLDFINAFDDLCLN